MLVSFSSFGASRTGKAMLRDCGNSWVPLLIFLTRMSLPNKHKTSLQRRLDVAATL